MGFPSSALRPLIIYYYLSNLYVTFTIPGFRQRGSRISDFFVVVFEASKVLQMPLDSIGFLCTSINN